jgi:glycosyltransferase involved in cell wall biosynthesis
LRIVYYLPDIDAGVSRIVKNLLEYRPENPDIKYVVVLIRRNNQREQKAGTDFNADEIIHFDYKKEENAFNVFKRLSKTLKTGNDIIVGNDGFEIKMIAAMKIKNPVVYIMHGDFNYYYSIVSHYSPVINSIIAYSNKIEREIKAIDGIDAHKVSKIYYPSASVTNLHSGLESEREKFKIVFAGLVIERKGADLLPRIYDNLVAEGMKNFELEIIGEGELLPEMKATLSNKQNVILSGWRSPEYVNKQLKGADVFLFPSRREGLPNVLIEALAAGAVPVVSNLESGVTDIIQASINGILVEQEDVAGFSDAILKLYRNRSYLQQLKSNAGLSLHLFEPYVQAKAYEDQILAVNAEDRNKERTFPAYKRGRVLDISWLPGWLVYFLRSITRNPKL